jgi:hypothetical protein
MYCLVLNTMWTEVQVLYTRNVNVLSCSQAEYDCQHEVQSLLGCTAVF